MLESGSITFLVPSYPKLGETTTGITQDYINFYDSGIYDDNILIFNQSPSYPYTGYTQDVFTGVTFDGLSNLSYTGATYAGIGASRLNELKKYGETGYTQTLYSGSFDDGIDYTGYTFTYTKDGDTTVMDYKDREDGYTVIMYNTTGFTQEEIINLMLTRNEHFLGFVEQPRIYSDIFVERGKQGVMEKNLRLGEIDNIGELGVYGNGYFNIKKQ